MRSAPRFVLILLLFIGTTCIAQNEQSGYDSSTLFITNQKIDSLIASSIKALEETNYTRSLNELRQARSLAKRIKNDRKQAATSATIAKIHLQLNQTKQARQENDEALAISRSRGDSVGVAQTYITASELLLRENKIVQAERLLKRAASIFDRFDVPYQLARVRYELGGIALKQKKYKEALDYLNESISLFSKDQDTFYLAQSELKKASALFELNQIKEAEEALTKIKAMDGIGAFTSLNNDITRLEAMIASKQGRYEEAFNKLKASRDSTISYNLAQNDEAASTPSIAISESLIKQLEKDIARQKERSLQMTRLTSVLAIAMLTILTLLTLSLYKNNNLRGKANELLQIRNNDLLAAKENAEKATAIKAQFLSTITHELRTPMYAVTGLTHLLLSENPTEEQKKHLDSLKFSGEYLLSLINNILDLNKLEANKVEVEETKFNLRKRVKDVMFALESSASDKGNKLKLDFDEDIPNELMGDPLLISQVLINLVGNAIKFTRDGNVEIGVQKIKQTQDTIHLHFKIKDDGEGISKKKQTSIFQSFTQGSATINRKFGGTGLGLSIVKNLLDLVGSDIQLESVLGQGSTFSFNLVYKLVEQQKSDALSNIFYEIDYAALEGKHILVVEDNKINQMITRKILEKNSITCELADNGEMAVDMVKKNRYDLILMDIHMPGITGIEATEQIREFNVQIPILALTAVTLDESTNRFFEVGFNDIIPKPYKVEEFFQKIHRALQASEASF